MKYFWVLVLWTICLSSTSIGAAAQSDSLQIPDSLETSVILTDSLADTDSVSSVEEEATTPELVINPESEWKEGMLRAAEKNYTGIFYFLLLILLVLGIFRLMEPTYFKHLFESFLATKRSVRQIKSKLGPDNLVNFLMNVIFYIVGGTYLFYVLQLFTEAPWLNHWHGAVMIILFSSALMLVYLVKTGFLVVLGKLFLIQDITDEYRYNIALINKMLALILIPVIFIILFGSPEVSRVITLVSFVIIGLALLNRYARSWESARNLVKNNRFHFFIYLCAFEILPFVVLAKVILSR